MYQTHYERAYSLFNDYRDYAHSMLNKFGIKSYYMILEEMSKSGDLSRIMTDKTGHHVDSGLMSKKYPRMLASLNVAMMDRAIKQSMDPYAFHLVANTAEQLEFYELCVRSYKIHNPDVDIRPYYGSMLTSVIQTWTHCIHEISGHKVYEVSPGLAERLIHTELRGLTSNDLKLPYRSIYVCIPEHERTSLKLFNEQTGWHNLEGFFLTEDLVGNDPSNPVRTWRFMFCGLSKDPNDAYNDALFHFSVELPDDKTVVQILDDEQGRVDNSDLISDPNAKSIFRVEWRKLFDWAMNVVMYSTWPDIDVEHFIANDEARALWNRIQKLPKGKKKDELKQRFKKIRPSERIRLGRNCPIFEDNVSDTHEVATRRVRTLVSGFWMRQAYGENRSLRKWRYQPPYWRNRESPIESNPVHVLI